MEFWKIAALLGAVLFLISGLLPMISPSLFDFSYYFSLINVYQAMAQGGASSVEGIEITAGAIGLLMTIFLYPIAVIAGFVGIAKYKAVLAAGILGLLCWVGALFALSTLNAIQFAGIGVYLGILGALMMATAYFMKPSSPAPQPPAPPPQPQYTTSR